MLRIAHAGAPGRLRLQADLLRGREDLRARVAALEAREPAIRAAELRVITGSVVVHHDPGTRPEAILAMVERAVESGSETASSRRGRPEPAVKSAAKPPAKSSAKSSAARSPRKTRRARSAAKNEAKAPETAASNSAAASRSTAPKPRRAKARAAVAAAPSAVVTSLEPPAPQEPPGAGWHSLSRRAAVSALGGDAVKGLDAAEAAARLARYGPNVAPSQERPSPFALFARQFEGLPVMMLVGSSAVSLASGGVADAVATLSVVLFNGVLGFVTEGEAERRIHALMDGSRQSALALRGGETAEILVSELVPGDLIEVKSGRQVPADARLLSTGRLTVDESALTGESLAVEKRADARIAADAPIGDRATALYAGTIVAEGAGRAIVVETGARTEAARIQALSTASGGRPQAPVEAELETLGAMLAKASLVACGLFVGIGLLRGYALRTMLKDALALAVAAVPEGLPMVATTTLSHGMGRMEKKGILIRQISVVETLGAVQTICLDKTGTLTQNRMQVVEAVAGREETALDDRARLGPLAEIAVLNNDAGPGGTGATSPTEKALIDFAGTLGADIEALRAARPRSGTVERAPGRPWMTTTHGGGAPLAAVKGAPEAVLARATHLIENGARRPLTQEDRDRILALNDRIASRPARVLGFASREGRLDDEERPDGLTWLGLVGMIDPLRPGAREFIAALHAAGVDTVLITGDQSATAAATAEALGLSNGAPLRVIDSTGLSDSSPELLASLASEAHVFARVSSQEKLAIVKALQAGGKVVAMTGDGVNDGPALNAADVGVAMGESGADLARDVANVVIRDDELGTLIEAIAQGRSIYRNIRRSLEFLITSNISEIAVSILETLHGPGELETPMELLWINLATDVLPGLGLALADPDEDAMRRPPRASDESIIPAHDMRRMALDSSVIAASAMASHLVGLSRYGPGPETRGMTFLSLSLGQLLYTLVCQHTDPRKLEPGKLLENRTLDLAVLGSIALAALPFFTPGLRRLLGIAPLRPADLAVALAAAATPFASVLARRGVVIALEERIHEIDAAAEAAAAEAALIVDHKTETA